MNIEKLASEIADEADECCYRQGEWKEGIRVLALQKLNDTYNDALEQAAIKLKQLYPDNASTNAFCAAIRSMKK